MNIYFSEIYFEHLAEENGVPATNRHVLYRSWKFTYVAVYGPGYKNTIILHPRLKW